VTSWAGPRKLARDQVVNATITYADGRTEALELLKRPTAGGGWAIMGFSRRLDLPQGSTVILLIDPTADG
jgi:hypothetical protein